MDKEIKDKWVAALRSGEYEQDVYYLHTAKGYCCIGVLCEVAKPEGWDGTAYKGNDAGFDPFEWDELFGGGSQFQTYLQGKNDSEGATFSEIADWIEANL